MYRTTTLPQPTPPARQPILAFQPAPPRPPTPPPMPTHDFLMLTACPDFTAGLNATGAANDRERVIQLCA